MLMTKLNQMVDPIAADVADMVCIQDQINPVWTRGFGGQMMNRV